MLPSGASQIKALLLRGPHREPLLGDPVGLCVEAWASPAPGQWHGGLWLPHHSSSSPSRSGEQSGKTQNWHGRPALELRGRKQGAGWHPGPNCLGGGCFVGRCQQDCVTAGAEGSQTVQLRDVYWAGSSAPAGREGARRTHSACPTVLEAAALRPRGGTFLPPSPSRRQSCGQCSRRCPRC